MGLSETWKTGAVPVCRDHRLKITIADSKAESEAEMRRPEHPAAIEIQVNGQMTLD